jgi:D-3-phosphoglycerate dehydrogenase
MRIGLVDPAHPVLQHRLEKAGHTCVALHVLSGKDQELARPTLEGIVVRSRRIDAAFMDQCPKLRFIARVGAGLENIDVTHARKRGIAVLNSPEGNRDGVGESCVMLLLALMKSLVPANMSVRAGLWPREALRGTDLSGKTVGIIGYGQMGSSFSEKLVGFGVRVLAHDKYKTGFGHGNVQESRLEDLLHESDVISLHLPLNEETKHYTDDRFFASLQRPVWFLNTSRGGVVDTKALLDAADRGRVIAAALDVLEFERPELDGLDRSTDPDTFDHLLRHDRILLTPHIAGVTHEGKYKMADVLATKIIDLFPHATT